MKELGNFDKEKFPQTKATTKNQVKISLESQNLGAKEHLCEQIKSNTL